MLGARIWNVYREGSPALGFERLFDNDEGIALLAEGRCPCLGCTGTLTDPARSPGGWSFCRACRCAWKISEIDHRRYATAIHSSAHDPAKLEKQR